MRPLRGFDIAQDLANSAMDSVSVFAADFSQQHITRATIRQRQQSAAARLAEHQVAFPISQSPALIGNVGALRQSGEFASLGGKIAERHRSRGDEIRLSVMNLPPIFPMCP